MHCSLSLDLPPTILQIGIGVHGAEPMERYRLDGLWCLHLYRYEAEVSLNGTPYAIAPGYAGVTAPGVEMEYHFRGPSDHAYAHFLLPAAGSGDAHSRHAAAGEDFGASMRRSRRPSAGSPSAALGGGAAVGHPVAAGRPGPPPPRPPPRTRPSGGPWN